MPITANCHCGHQFRVRDEYAGKKAQCPNCGNAMVIPLAEGQTDAEQSRRIWTPHDPISGGAVVMPRTDTQSKEECSVQIWTPATSKLKATTPKALSPPGTFDSAPSAPVPEPLSKVSFFGEALGPGLICLAASLFLSLISGFLWLITLTTIANWLLWLSWWVVMILSGILTIDNWDTTKLPLWKRLLSTGASGVLMIAVLWGHDSYYDYLFAPTNSETTTASQDKRPTPSHQQSNPHRPLETTQTNLQQLETRREAVQGLLNKTKGDQQQVILQMRRLGITTTQDLKSHPQGRVLVDEFQRLVGEIKGLEMAVVRIEEAMVKTRALIRSIERSQVLGEAGLSDEEIKELSERLMIADEKEDGTSTPVSVDPVQTDALLREALSQKQEDDSVQKDR